MQIDLEHIMFWMDAIRNSSDPTRTLESFWKGQLKSKEWLIKELGVFVGEPVSIDIFGGWNGVLASMLFHAPYPIKSIRSIDIDPACEEIANTMNKIEHMNGRFRAVTADMCNLRSDADVAINTSCEHITQDQYEEWLTCLPYNSLIVLQSNNYRIDEHIRIVNSLEEFESQCNLAILKSSTLKLPLYDRYLIIGKKYDDN
jgi:hypothetical protein